MPVSGRLNFRLLNLAFILIVEEVHQVFMVPMLLFYTSDVFSFDAWQNRYIISILQAARALFLTAIFPLAVAAVRRWISAHFKKRKETRRKVQLRKTKPHGGAAGTRNGEMGALLA